ncbi:hypothetical protein CBL_00539 [Carabus blaptoides fortunei]
MVFWITVQCLCFALCLWLMAIHWFRYQSRPTVTTIKSTAYPISDIPFPAVTVCNSNLVYKKNIDVYVDILKNKGVNETLIEKYFNQLNYLIQLDTSNGNDNLSDFAEVQQIFNDLNISTSKMMRHLAHPCNEMVTYCTWAGVKYNCSDLFKTVKSGLGFCCSFNYHNALTNTNEPLPEFNKPVVANGAGMTHGLGILVNIDADQYVSSVLPFDAVFILVHPNWDYADLSAFSIAVQPGDFALMQLTPTVYTSESVLKSVSVDRRNCWFGYEGDLQSSHDYSFSNCVTECKAKAIYSLCKCIPYYFPSLGKREQCTLQHAECLKNNENTPVANITACNCLPECEDVLYDGYLNAVKGSLNGTAAYAQIYYDHSWCVEYNQSLNLTWDVLLASLGGIFGLCLGGSLISLVEVVFYIFKSIILTIVQCKKVVPQNQFKQKNINTRITTVAHY